ncbi:MAG: DUF5671 domain-containing protein [Chloroflexota bacterium]|nr:DUF5671 domain-containing protein [Chloroflexota bacterium]
MNESRTLPAVQRAYLYIVALVAIHMIVLAVANLLRVGAEIAMNAPSGGFTGLPFVFSDFSRPRELYREQASLAIALLAVGGPAWWLSFRAADGAARREVAARASAIRSLYVHLVIFVTALLVFGYGQRTLGLILQGTFVGELPGFFIEPEWRARAVGAGAMALSAAGALAYHVRISLSDRRATVIGGRAAEIRHLALYALAVIGLFFAAFSTAFTLQGLWDRVVADAISPLNRTEFFGPPGVAVPTRDEMLRFQLVNQIPPILAGLALWLGTWLPLQRGLRRAGADGEIERRSVIRKLAIYFIVGLSAIVVLVSATLGAAEIIRRLLGDPLQEQYTSLVHSIGIWASTIVIFGPLWLFHRRVVEAEAARETELARAAAIRRSYTYVVAAFGLAMAAIGAAGTVGVLGSQLLGMNTHQNGEIATYLSLVLVGLPAWGFHWWQARRRLDEAERRAPQRRAYLYLAVLGGAIGLLVFGSAALYRLLNAALAADFPLSTWHDIWHFAMDAAVAGAVFAFHLRVIRADRSVTAIAAAAETAPSVFTYVVRVTAASAAAARARLAAALPEAQVTPADAASGESDGGPSVVAIAGSILGVLLILFVLTSFPFRLFLATDSSVPPQQAVPLGRPIWVASVTQGSFATETTGGAYVRTEGALTFNFKESGAATVTFPEFAAPFIAVAVISSTPATDGTLLWRVRAVGDRSVALRVNLSSHSADLVYQDNPSGVTELLGNAVPLRDTSNAPMELMVLVRTPGYVVFIDGKPMIEVTESRLDTTSSALTMTATGTTGMIALLELRVHEAP